MLHAIRRSWTLLSRRQKAALAALATARVVANGLDIFGIAIIGVVGALALGSTERIPFVDEQSVPRENLLVGLLLCAAVIFSVKTIVGLALSRATLLYLAKIETLFSLQIAGSIFTGDYNRLRRLSQSEIEWAILRSPYTAFSGFLGSAIGLLGEVSLAALVFGFLLYTDWALALGITAYFCLILLVFHIFSQRAVLGAGEDHRNGSIAVAEAIKNFVQAFKEISVLSKTTFFLAPLAELRGRVARGEATNQYLAAVPRLIIELGLIIGAIGFVAFQYARDDGLSSLVTFGVFLMGSLRMMSALLPLQRAFQAIKFGTPSALAAQELMWELRQTVGASSNDTAGQSAQTSWQATTDASLAIGVESRGASFEYDDTDNPSVILRDLSLVVAPGTTVAIVGPSGAGKSTLVNLILGLLEPTTGDILCGGLAPRSLRARHPGIVGYVPQKPGIITGTIEQNIALGLPVDEIDRTAILDAVEAAQLTDLVADLPDGLSTSLGKHSDSLSGGQLQRLGLARALYTRPRLLVLDEATSALDAETEEKISKSLAALRGTVTIIIVAHRLSTVQNADVIHVLDGGRIVASGSFQELRMSNPLVKKYSELMSLDD
jgi:ATP-binding cassette, subfamily B, bacterial PglK